MISCRTAKESDCDSIIKIHLQSFENFFLTTLGSRFLKSFYKSCIRSQGAITLVCCNETGDVFGFAMGSIQSDGFYKRLFFRNLLPFSYEALILLFTKPDAIVRLVKNMRKSSANETVTSCSELLSIASLPELKGQGVGKQLIEVFENRIRESGSGSITLTTDYSDNDDVLKFYARSGYKISHDFVTHPHRRMYRLIKRL